MAKQKYYAVKNGKIKGVYFTWKDCQAMVIGFPNAVYKSFEDPYEAMDFALGKKRDTDQKLNTVEEEKKEDVKSEEKCDTKKKDNIEYSNNTINVRDNLGTENYIEAYVDGSFDVANKSYGSGGVLIKGGEVIDSFSIKGTNPENVSMRNVAGEIEASMYAMQYCADNGYEKLILYFDYNGIEKWCTGEWKANKTGTKEYKRFYEGIKDKVDVSFVKVKAHTGVEYNEMADRLAKESIFGK